MKQMDEHTFKIGSSGLLDNKTIIRFSHATSSGAGTESHIACLNNILLQRNNMTILYLYMPDEQQHINIQTVGKGTLIKIPLDYQKSNSSIHLKILQKFIVKCSAFLPGFDSYIPHFREAVNVKDTAKKLFSDYSVDLVINHFVGSKGSLEIMKETTTRQIPILVINHFHNSWYGKLPIRNQMRYAHIAAGLSEVKIPRYLKSRFVNLSNGIDTDFFNPDKISCPIPQNIKPQLLLPARVVKNKGHLDLLKILRYLRNHGLYCSAVFAGRYDSPAFKSQLENFIHENNLDNDVIFTGTLSPESMRQIYSQSTLMVLPTYHDEGLPRVVLESQAMQIPPVCYDSGGVPESILDGQTGFYFKKGNLSGMCRKISELLKDSSQRIKMGAEGRKFIVKNFSLSSLAERHELTYFKLIDSPSQIP